MAGLSKDINISEIFQGGGDLWVIATAPTDLAPRLALASDGTPNAATHGASVHLGAIASAINVKVTPKHTMLTLDQYDAPIDAIVSDIESSIEADLAQVDQVRLAHALGVGTASSGSGYRQLVFGGTVALPTVCIAAIGKRPVSGSKYLVACLYKAGASGGIQIVFGRSKMSSAKAKFLGFADLTRTAGRQVGMIHETLTDATGGTPTAKAITMADVQMGPGDLWLINPAPDNTDKRVNIDATTLTPDATDHADSVHLGATAGEISMTLTPKIGVIKIDQCDAPVGLYLESLEAKIEAEMSQSACDKLAAALGIGTYDSDAAYRSVSWGGVDQPAPVCIAAIAKKRSDPTQAGCMCLYRVQPSGGIEISMSRKKASTYKVSATGLLDLDRTAGSQMGIYHETVAT